jgi:hypothetical protein
MPELKGVSVISPKGSGIFVVKITNKIMDNSEKCNI